MTLDILYEDNHLLVLLKPAGILAQGDATGDADILSLAKAYLKQRYNKPGKVYLGLVHRLDRPVSGIMVLARTSKAAARLSQQFRDNKPVKKYLAGVEGVAAASAECCDFLRKQEQRVTIVGSEVAGAREARLEYRRLMTQFSTSLLDVRLHTGRPHQIRVQLAARELPIIGDLRYGATSALRDRSLALHCYSLRLTHPVRHCPMQWSAAPPKHWRPHFQASIESRMREEMVETAKLHSDNQQLQQTGS